MLGTDDKPLSISLSRAWKSTHLIAGKCVLLYVEARAKQPEECVCVGCVPGGLLHGSTVCRKRNVHPKTTNPSLRGRSIR